MKAQSRLNPWEESLGETGAPQRLWPPPSDFSPLSQFQCILGIDAEIPGYILDLFVTERNLDRTEIASGSPKPP